MAPQHLFFGRSLRNARNALEKYCISKTADDIIAVGNEIGSAPKVEIRKRFAEIGHERFDVVMAPAWRMQRVLQEHVGSGELVNDAQVAGFPPEVRKPAA
jgi:hypothetical protein